MMRRPGSIRMNWHFFCQERTGFMRKMEEVHYQRAYSLEKIKELIGKAGMELLAVYDAYTLEPPREDSGQAYLCSKGTW